MERAGLQLHLSAARKLPLSMVLKWGLFFSGILERRRMACQPFVGALGDTISTVHDPVSAAANSLQVMRTVEVGHLDRSGKSKSGVVTGFSLS